VSVQPYAGALEAVDRILNREPEADEALRQTVAVVENRIAHYVWVGILFAEQGTLVLGPAVGEHDAGTATIDVPVVYDGQQVALLQVATTEPGNDDGERAFLERVALLVSAHCLVGWDTGGEPWPDAS
jgi:putative methionine-R-sulfoxide reductase with GAF domain